ncbi:prephenate dehydratase [Leptolyngbyaceae cyanobacterium CCMR0082]|uniref:Prephenate dehydratase n=2 Tax=Adonisia turfae TaxID=2950184 RepID=A0A6M0S455_9CYAN|nr:prephenate dehydratase [Adonisia turfae]MDV3349428.1 prephenate dehydratase [Leptothoe sp. LEGE 181152]NEZ54899.1 prephenate dehydratase [Adonisia turfae CCMR0081]NEZ62843.1 prephenate dehydratase [Adonisia turfae CCMR0082]
MTSIAHLGPAGSYSELAATNYAHWLKTHRNEVPPTLKPYSTISKAIQAAAAGETDTAVVPIENSIGGSVRDTLDMLWELDSLKIQNNLVIPIHHALLSQATSLDLIKTVYSHPQALTQCQKWLATNVPNALQIATSSTTEALPKLSENKTFAAISPLWAAKLYNIPTLADPINDTPDNATRFWVLGQNLINHGSHTSLAFRLPDNTPGALLKPLQLFATQGINMSRIESRPTKLALGDYRFFIDIEASLDDPNTQAALQLLKNCTKSLKVFGSYKEIKAQIL